MTDHDEQIDEQRLDQVRDIVMLLLSEQTDDALEALEAAFAANPESPELLCCLGIVAFQKNDRGRAIDLMTRAHEADPDCRDYADALAVLHTLVGHLTDGLYFAKLSVALEPHPEIFPLLPLELSSYFESIEQIEPSRHYLDGIITYNSRRFPLAIEELERELRINPDHSDCRRLLGRAYHHGGQFEESARVLEQAVTHAPNDALAHIYLGDAYYRLGNFERALEVHRQALKLDSESPEIPAQALNAAEFRLDDYEAVREEFHSDLTARAASLSDELIERRPSTKDSDRIRIGYVCNSLHFSELAAFLIELLRHHNRNRFEVHVYQLSLTADSIFMELKNAADSWRRIVDMDDELLSVIIAGDEIDILIDLCGYTENSRLNLFALRPAPIQTALLSPPYGLGVPGFDLVISDPVTEQADRSVLGPHQKQIVSQLGMWSISPFALMSDVTDTPALGNGHITFGARCDPASANPHMVELWSRILKSVPGSRLLFGNVLRIGPDVESHMRGLFDAYGTAGQLDFWDTSQDQQPNPKFYDAIDIFLDSYPVSGVLNLCEALWKGVSVVTLKGDRRSSMMGASVLTSAGQVDGVCESEDEVVDLSVRLASDVKGLNDARLSLRNKVENSLLFSPGPFVHMLETTFEEALRAKADTDS